MPVGPNVGKQLIRKLVVMTEYVYNNKNYNTKKLKNIAQCNIADRFFALEDELKDNDMGPISK